MVKHAHSKRVRYGETDQMGYLYYGNYALYYEIGRVELFRSLGMSYRELEEELGVMMPVVNMSARYLRPARYDQLIRIETSIRQLPLKQVTFDFELFNEAGELVNGGRVTLCFVNTASGERVPCPEPMLELLRPHFA